MDLRSVEALLEKYYDGATSLEEERQLKAFFNSDNVPDALRHEQMQFRYYNNAAAETTNTIIDTIPDTNKTTAANAKRTIRFKPGIAMAAALAAGIALLLGVTIMMKQEAARKTNTDTYKDPRIAYAETKKALLLVSAKLNKGNKNLTKLSKLYEAQSLIKNNNQ